MITSTTQIESTTMSTYNQLTRPSVCYNPYSIGGYEVKNIHFFDPRENKVLTSENMGWLVGAIGGNNDGNSALEALQFKVKRTVDLTLNESFHVGTDVYVCVSQLNNFKCEYDRFHYASAKGQKNYATFLTFDFGFTNTDVTHLKEVKTREIMIGKITRVEYTGLSLVEHEFITLVKTKETDLYQMDVRNLLKWDRESRTRLAELLLSDELK